MNEIKIQRYKVGDFKHHVPESIDKAFKAEVNKAGKQRQPDGDPYLISSDEHKENCDNPVEDNKIFHPEDEVLTEAIQDVNVKIYKVGDDFKVHCPLDLMDALANQIAFHNQ